MTVCKIFRKPGMIAVFFAACSFCFGESQSLQQLLSSQTAAELLKTGKIERTIYMEDYTPQLFPKTALGVEASRIWENSGKSKKPVFYHEGLYLTKKECPTKAGANLDRLSKVVRAISSLEGIEYYSNTRKRMRILYEESYAVDGPASKNRIADPTEGSADGAEIYAVQKDSTFGRFVYKYSYQQNETEVLSKVANIDPLSLMGIKIINPDDLLISLLVSDLGDYYLVYTLIETDVISMSMIENKLKLSFAARADALYGWLSKVFVEIDEENALLTKEQK
ncbi:MAG: hypothetical protein MJ196_03870 [Treponemataceae bacterium]|nr:hypothetical protein [Treponemataceae bacterium]